MSRGPSITWKATVTLPSLRLTDGVTFTLLNPRTGRARSDSLRSREPVARCSYRAKTSAFSLPVTRAIRSGVLIWLLPETLTPVTLCFFPLVIV